MIIDVEQDETGWTVTAQGTASAHPFRANLRRCTAFHYGSNRRTSLCDGKHENELIKLVKALRASYR